MYNEKTIAVVVPAYNEELLIEKTLKTLPDMVDRIIVVDDASTDRTSTIVEESAKGDKRIFLLRHDVNSGVGGAIVSGYKNALESDIDITVVMAGDAQMDPDDFLSIIGPIAEGRADYAKGNRLFYGDALSLIHI